MTRIQGQARSRASRPWVVSGVVLAAYGLWLLGAFASGHQARDFIYIGSKFINQGHTSQVIRVDPGYPNVSDTGYDGQFFYYIALDPVHARAYMDVSAYRYTRILYPLTARALAFGRADLVPVTLILINWLSIAGGTFALAVWLRRKGLSPWFAIVFGLYPGLHMALQRDLSEALAYSLVAVAVLLFDREGLRWRWLSAGVFALAALTRETTAIFALVYGIGLLLGGRIDRGWWPRARSNLWVSLAFLAMALGPLLAYKVFLEVWLGSHQDIGIPLAVIPFSGLWHWRYWDAPTQREEIVSVVIPGVIAGVVAVVAVVRRQWRPAIFLLLGNVLLFVVFLQLEAYEEIQASARVSTGVVLSAVLCLPLLGATAGRRRWFLVSGALWLAQVPFWLLLPTAAALLRLVRG